MDEEGNKLDTSGRSVHVNMNNEFAGGNIYFYWQNGQKCWNGPNRSLKLRLLCGDSVRIQNLIEPSMCVYEGEFVTPAVCPL